MPTEVSTSELQKPASSALETPIVPASGQSDEVSLLDIVTVIAERKTIVGAITIGIAITAIVVSLVLPQWYTASVALLPPQQNTSLSSTLASQLGSLGTVGSLAGSSLGLKDPNQVFVAMLRSRTVEDAMVQRFGLMNEYRKERLSDARKAFEKHSEVDGSGKDTLIRISVEDQDPKRAALLANSYVEEFRKLSETLAIGEASRRRLFFEGQLLLAKDNLANAELALKQTEQKTGLIQLDSQARALIESAATLRAQIAAKEVQIEALRTSETNENPQLVQLQQELESMRAQLAELGGSEESADIGLILPKGNVPEAGLEYVRKLRDVKYYETIFDILARQFEFAKLDEARQGPVVQVVDLAIPPDRRSFPKRALIVLAATVVGFILGILVVLIQAGYEWKIGEPEVNRKIQRLRRALSFRRGMTAQ